MEYLIAIKIPDFSAKAYMVAIFIMYLWTDLPHRSAAGSGTKTNQNNFFFRLFFSFLLLYLSKCICAEVTVCFKVIIMTPAKSVLGCSCYNIHILHYSAHLIRI